MHHLFQISNILNEFQKQNYEFLPEKYITKNWLCKWQKSFKLNIEILEKKGFDVGFLQNFLENNLPEIMSEQKLGLVYNDAHFDNFIYDKGMVYLIDFDRILYGSVDYEILIIKQMLDNPKKFASKNDEPNINNKDYSQIYELLQKNSPQMFNFKHFEYRVFIYQFIYNLGQAYEYENNAWIEKELQNFKKYFGVN